ncbi:hypothetical protein F4802DRAFT_573224 [Xylaria palmicola]|nr:hypothetical protein F4802DRAFT_573224 [Xylaria palmicola]
MSRRPLKLRSSCDSCSIVKVKCDRGQPECGRCISRGLPCVYGVSRKMGKPPRNRAGADLYQRDRGLRVGAGNADPYQGGNTFTGASLGFGAVSHPGESAVSDTKDLFVEIDALDVSAYTPFDLGDLMDIGQNQGLFSANLQFDPPSLLNSPGVEVSGLSIEAPPSRTTSLEPLGGWIPTQGNLPPQASSSTSERWYSEMYEILGSLTTPCPATRHRPSLSSSTSMAMEAFSLSPLECAFEKIRLDDVLRLIKEASERLGHIFASNDDKSPTLALLSATVISRILSWCRQIVATMHRDPQTTSHGSSSTSVVLNPSQQCQATQTTTPPTVATACSQTNSAASTTMSLQNAPTTPVSSQSLGMGLTLATMTVGSFDVDDLRVQAALKLQLLLGEMRRVGLLINRFAAYQSGHSGMSGDAAFRGLDGLGQSLEGWLRDEHSRVATLVKSRLREMNTLAGILGG